MRQLLPEHGLEQVHGSLVPRQDRVLQRRGLALHVLSVDPDPLALQEQAHALHQLVPSLLSVICSKIQRFVH